MPLQGKPALQNKNASRMARRSTERTYYIPAIIRIKLKSLGQEREESKVAALKPLRHPLEHILHPSISLFRLLH
jgi:hypothetical protein